MSHCNEPFWRTGSFANRWISRTPSTPRSSVPSIARPLSAPRSNARKCAVTISQGFEPDVAKFHFHGRADVHLKPDQPAQLTVLQVLIDHHAHDGAVQDLDDRAAARDQVNLVPVAGLDERLQLLGRLLQIADHLRATTVRNVGGLAAQREKPAPALLVDLARVLIVGIDVRLIALHHPFADVRACRQLHAADLHAAVRGAEPVLELQLEVPGTPAAPDEKRILFDGVLARALAGQRAVQHSPERRIAVPALHRRAVENRFESGLVGHREGLRTRRRRATAPSPLRRTRAGLRSQRGGGDDGNGKRVLHGCASQPVNESFIYATFTCAAGMVSHWRVFADFNTASVTQSVASPSRNVGGVCLPSPRPSRKSANWWMNVCS